MLPAAALLSGCGTLVVIPSGAEQVIRRLELRTHGTQITNVHCPDGVNAKVGVTFECHFNLPDGTKYTAHMRIVRVHAPEVDYFVSTFPS
jgi:hypothetical protein